MGLDVSSRIVVGVPLADLVASCGIVKDPVTKYNEDTGEPYQTTKSRKAYTLKDGREITVKYFGGNHLLAALGPKGDDEYVEFEGKDASGDKDYNMSEIGLGYYQSCYYEEEYDRDHLHGIVGIRVVATGSNRSREFIASAKPVLIIEAVERVRPLLAEHFGYEGDVSVLVQSVLSF